MKKIMFNDKYGLTEAVLTGRKMQTRRIADQLLYHLLSLDAMTYKMETINSSRYKIGEVVAIAQSYNALYDEGTCFATDFTKGKFLLIDNSLKGWRNKMFVKATLMPHHIKITNIRVERLQDISEEDCLKEGIKRKNERYVIENEKGVCFYTNDVILAFSYLIDKTCGKGTWDSNPYVFVYDFELVD